MMTSDADSWRRALDAARLDQTKSAGHRRHYSTRWAMQDSNLRPRGCKPLGCLLYLGLPGATFSSSPVAPGFDPAVRAMYPLVPSQS